MSQSRRELLKEKLGELYLSYDAGYVDSDPIQFPHRYGDARDKEVAGFIASALAYGSVATIKKDLEIVFTVLGADPYDAVLTARPNELLSALGGFKHRFTTARHLAWFLLATKEILSKHGSLKAFFLEGYSKDAPTIRDSLGSFAGRFLRYGGRTIYRSVEDARDDGALFLVPSPLTGSACKRLNLFLRWMVRTADKIDFGLWPEVSPSQLVIPLDTHVARLSHYLGLTRRKTSDWKTAEEITQALKTLDPRDPLKYDFSLTRLGILRDCVVRKNDTKCRECLLVGICERGAAVARGRAQGAS
ncbi:MAG: TIGR02757 family protein [Candidatus Eisenbacteria bacterium]|nr:TIGR02757 family protein [Candidatus Eisenbacteria bacterium]